MSSGKSVRLFLADGTPGGLLTAEIINWTGHVVAAPRSDLGALLKRPEAGRTGIYILLGDDPNSIGGTVAYIGEGDDVSKRLYLHARPESDGGKDFWDRAVVVTNKDANLTKAHARYLESRLIALAQQAGRVRLVNGTAPTPQLLPEADISDMEYFIAQAKIVLPLLGINILRSVASIPPGEQSTGAAEPARTQTSPILEMSLQRHGVTATAQEVDGEFTVHKDSVARPTWTGVDDGYKRLREKLEADGTLAVAVDRSSAVFTRDHVFASPSAAAAVVAGRNANGRDEWKVQGTTVSFGSWQRQGVEQAVASQSIPADSIGAGVARQG
jgi:hypothetical protein